ncbi:MAG: hypothetical protein ACXWL2_00125 [Candidatus Chromulinivorax sp.]
MIKKITITIIFFATNLYPMQYINPECLLNFHDTDDFDKNFSTKNSAFNQLINKSKKNDSSNSQLNHQDIINNISSKFKKDAGKSDLHWKEILQNFEHLTIAEQKNVYIALKTICPAANVKDAMQNNLILKGYNAHHLS